MEAKPQTNNWAEMDMPSDDEESHQHQHQAHNPEDPKEENPSGYRNFESGNKVEITRAYKRKPQLSREEMVEKIRTFKGQVFLNLLNVDYKATEQDLLELFSDVKIKKIEKTEQRGIFLLLVEDANEALKLFTEEEKTLNGRKISVRLSAPKKREGYERTEGNFNKERRPYPEGGYNNKYGGGESNKYGGGERKPYNNNKDYKDSKGSYNRKDFHEPAQYGDEGFQRSKGKPMIEERVQDETQEKKGEESTRKPFGFTRAGAGGPAKPQEKKEEIPKKEENTQAKPQKSNPFGAAKPRDENDYVKKKKEEGKAEVLEEIKELKGSQVEKIEKAPPVKNEEKPKPVEKKEEEEFIVANKKKGNKRQNDKPPVVQKDVPKVEEAVEKGKEKKKPTTTKNVFSQLAGEEEEGEENDN